MIRIDRSLRTVAVALASALLVACGSDEATAPREHLPPDVQPAPTSPVGAWTSRRIDGKAMPARILGGTEPEGYSWEVHVLHDSVIVAADGTWRQRVRVQESNTRGEIYPGSHNDYGTWTRQGNTIHFVSEWIENVEFDAELTSDGLVVMHDFTLSQGELPALRREMKR